MIVIYVYLLKPIFICRIFAFIGNAIPIQLKNKAKGTMESFFLPENCCENSQYIN
jgi:hypothetical protein